MQSLLISEQEALTVPQPVRVVEILYVTLVQRYLLYLITWERKSNHTEYRCMETTPYHTLINIPDLHERGR